MQTDYQHKLSLLNELRQGQETLRKKAMEQKKQEEMVAARAERIAEEKRRGELKKARRKQELLPEVKAVQKDVRI